MAEKSKAKKILFVTGNAKKLREAKAILSDFEIENKKVDLEEIQGTVPEIIEKKVKTAYEIFKCPLIVEDVSLEFASLNGLPGPYIKDFQTKLGNVKLAKLLEAFEDKSATAICTIGYIDEKNIVIISGETEGKIVAPFGENDFGWDPIFVPDGYDETYAEMDETEKNKISHRKKAFEKLKEYLNHKNDD